MMILGPARLDIAPLRSYAGGGQADGYATPQTTLTPGQRPLHRPPHLRVILRQEAGDRPAGPRRPQRAERGQRLLDDLLIGIDVLHSESGAC